MNIRKLLFAFTGAFFTPLTVAADVTGTWALIVKAVENEDTPTFELVQEGETVTGSYIGEGGESKVAGTLKGDDLVLTSRMGYDDPAPAITYIAKVDGNKMSGKVQFPAMGEGNFEGVKNQGTPTFISAVDVLSL